MKASSKTGMELRILYSYKGPNSDKNNKNTSTTKELPKKDSGKPMNEYWRNPFPRKTTSPPKYVKEIGPTSSLHFLKDEA